MPLKAFGVVLLGPGQVGRAVLSRLRETRGFLAKRHNIQFDLKAVADSSGCVICPTSQQSLDYNAVIDWKSSGKRLAQYANGTESGSNLSERLTALANPRTFVVDCSASSGTASVLRGFLDKGGYFVACNKKPLTGPMSDFQHFTSPHNIGRCLFESTVGAGTPFLSSLTRVIQSGDSVRSIQGTFSGTLGYLTSGLQDGRKFSEIVRDAFKNGLTEPDPRDDLSGTDVARKALILARMLGWEREMGDVEVQALYPPEFAKLSVPEFLDALDSLDADFAKMSEEASIKDSVLRYVARIDDGRCSVKLRSVPLDNPIGRLSGTDNIIQISTDIYFKQPLVIQGAGAGLEVTSAGVVADMVDLASRA